MYVISGSTHQRLGASLAEEMNAEFCGVVNRHFPDGERYIRVLMDVANQDVVVVQNTFPDKKIVELLLILEAVKKLVQRPLLVLFLTWGIQGKKEFSRLEKLVLQEQLPELLAPCVIGFSRLMFILLRY